MPTAPADEAAVVDDDAPCSVSSSVPTPFPPAPPPLLLHSNPDPDSDDEVVEPIGAIKGGGKGGDGGSQFEGEFDRFRTYIQGLVNAKVEAVLAIKRDLPVKKEQNDTGTLASTDLWPEVC